MTPPTRRHLVAATALAAALGLVAGGCTSPPDDGAGAPPTPPGPAGVYVAVGASETVGVGADQPFVESWPQVFYRDAVAPNTTFYNLGIPGSTVAEALTQQLPEAVRLAPALVTVWLNVNDLVAGVPAATYEEQLGRLLNGLRGGGRTRVLVANTPPLERLPSYLACRPGGPARPCDYPTGAAGVPAPERIVATVAGYNAAVARVAAGTGAEVVDLDAVVQEARAAGSDAALVGEDGFHPSTAGHRAVAAAFAAVLGRRP